MTKARVGCLALLLLSACLLGLVLILTSDTGNRTDYDHGGASTSWEGIGEVFRVILYLLAAGLGTALIVAIYAVGLALWFRTMNARLDIAERRVRQIWPDESGLYPILSDGHTAFDPNRGVSFDLEGIRSFAPEITRPEQLARMLRAARAWPKSSQAGANLLAEPEVAIQWPKLIPLEELLRKHQVKPNLHRILLGETWQDGTWQPVVGDMETMVHVLVSGASGFGKSTLLESVAKQLVTSGDCDLCAVDYGVNTFGALQAHFIYPIADTPALALALFQDLIEELNRRKALFKKHPLVKNLRHFNEVTGANLRFIVCLCDESASLFTKDGMKEPLVELAQMSRKYGLGLICAGTDFKATTLPTEASGNFSTRIAYHLRPSLSQSVIYSRDASKLHEKGRALALLPGNAGLIEMQCPVTRQWDDLPAPTQEQRPLGPVNESSDDTKDNGEEDHVQRILELARKGESKRQICLKVFGYTGGKAFEMVTRVLESDTTT